METHADIRKREQDVRRGVGRPFRNPFRYPEVEQDFYRRAREVVAHCYDPSPENEKKPFRVGGRRMGKAAFWAFVYYFYAKVDIRPAERDLCPLFPELELPLLENNQDHFLMLLKKHVPDDCLVDRSAFCKMVNKLDGMSLGFYGKLEELSDVNVADKLLKKHRSIYHEVLRLWNAV